MDAYILLVVRRCVCVCKFLSLVHCRDDAKALNRRSTLFKIAVSVSVFGIFLLFVRFFLL